MFWFQWGQIRAILINSNNVLKAKTPKGQYINAVGSRR